MTEQQEEEQPCRECFGTTIVFKGQGKDAMYMLCPRWTEPGHLSEGEVNQKIQETRKRLNPSGRFA